MGKLRIYYLKTLNKPSIYPLGKTPSAPSDTVFRRGIICHNTGEEEADPTLELAMEYAGALGTIIFDKSCCLHDLTEAQVGRNQFAIDVAVDQLDGEVDHASERISALEGKVADLEAGYTELLALGWEQVEMSTRVA